MESYTIDGETWQYAQRKTARPKRQQMKTQATFPPLPVQDDQDWAVRMSKEDRMREPEFMSPQTMFCTPHCNDIVFAAAHAAVEKHNHSTLANFCYPLRIRCLIESPTILQGRESEIQQIALTHQGVVLKIPFKIVLPRADPEEEPQLKPTLLCNMWPGWQSFDDYLKSRRVSRRPETGSVGWTQQKIWWANNGKSFRIMDLPAELRGMVLQQAIGHRHHPLAPYHYQNKEHCFRPSFWRLGIGSESDKYEEEPWYTPEQNEPDPTKEIVAKPNCNVLLAHPKLYYEVKDSMRRGVPQAFEGPSYLRAWIEGPLLRTPGGLQSLQHLDLDFSHVAYMHFFGVDVQPFERRHQISALILPSLSGLKSLRLHFRSTIDAATTDPWGYTGEHNGNSSNCDLHGYSSGNFLTSCQKVIVDWILTFAHDYIQHIPRILLSGYIKNSTKAKWDATFADTSETKGQEIAAARLAIRNWPVDALPPRCKCSTLCAFSGRSLTKHIDEGIGNCFCTICKSAWTPEGYPSRQKERVEYVFDLED